MNEKKQPLKVFWKSRYSKAVTGSVLLKGVLTNFAKFTAKICARVKLEASVWNFVKKETLRE